MNATIIPFARNLFAELDKLKIFTGLEPTVDELLHRHEKIGKLMDEGFAQRDRGLFDWRKFEIIVNAYHQFHHYCFQAGVDQEIVAGFNRERLDWKYYRTLPGRF